MRNGGIIGLANTPTTSVASGVWSLQNQQRNLMVGDPDWDSVSLLIQPDADEAASDVGPTGHTVTEVGNANITAAESRFGGYAVELDGTGDWLTLPAHANFDFGTGDFTIEMFVMFDATTNYQVPITSRQYYTAGKNGNWVLRTDTSLSNLVFASYDGTSSVTVITGTYTFSTATWYHIAISRVSSTLSIYVDGVSKGSGTESRNLLDGGDGGIAFGENTGGNSAFNGHIDGVRVTKGVGRYTGNFDVPTAAFPTRFGKAVSWVPDPTNVTYAYLQVGGGASGGGSGTSGTYAGSGGGGAGGYAAVGDTVSTKGKIFTITIGAGAAVDTSGTNGAGFGVNGGDTVIAANSTGGAFSTVTMNGGGGGGAQQMPVAGAGKANGNASGGGGSYTSAGGAGGANGNAGGTSTVGAPRYPASGGGGAGAVGGNGTGYPSGAGGVGLAWAVNSVYYGGGGGGGCYDASGTVGAAGNGGGGAGGARTASGAAGTANTGGGGGGGGTNGGNSATGGSGVIIMALLSTTATGTTGSPTVGSSGSYTTYTFTSSGTLTL